MSKPQSVNGRRATSAGISALFALAAMPMENAPAQPTCENALSVSPVISPISGSKVVLGQTITIQRVFFGSGDPGACLFRNGEGYLLYPNGTVVKVVTNLNLNPLGDNSCHHVY